MPTIKKETKRSSAIVGTLKLVIVGNDGTGKTCLVYRCCDNRFPEIYVPTVYMTRDAPEELPNARKEWTDKSTGRLLELGFWDTVDDGHADRLRPLSYPDTDVFLICFSIEDRESFEDIREKWIGEIHHFAPKVPRILVGLKRDLRQLRENPDISLVSMEEAQQLAQGIGCHYIECSAKRNAGVDEVLDMAVTAAANGQRARRRSISSRLHEKGCNVL